jgi:hypothetical protein
MAKKKGKVDLIEKTLDSEIETVVAEATPQPPPPASNTPEHQKSDEIAAAHAAPNETSSFKLRFFGRNYMEERFPEPLRWADRFAQEWVQEGSFEFLPVAHPRAKNVLIMGIKNIRAAEKKVEQTYSEKVAPLAKLATERVEKLIHQLRS